MSSRTTIIATTKCRECGGVMEGRKGEYKYTESGLNSVTLKDILVFHCTQCNDIVAEIPAVGILHRIIAMRLLLKKTLLTGKELRFLRKLCGYSINDFGEVMGSNKSVVSRWENNNNHGDTTDRNVRLLVLAKLLGEIAGKTDPVLKITVQELTGKIETALRLIQGRRANEKYDISPEELARFGGEETRETPTAAPSIH